jgi:hypothetical protein
MSRPGRDYERFVYHKLKVFFPDAQVVLNDKILGRQSDLLREIDISIRMAVEDIEILYIVSCKDREKRPADIQVLGEFSSVIQDVDASKGFLVCTSGFAKSNHRYARTLGIELLTVEDVESDRWHAEIQVPLIYIKKTTKYALEAHIIANEELVALNKEPILVHLDVNTLRLIQNIGNSSIPAPPFEYKESSRHAGRGNKQRLPQPIERRFLHQISHSGEAVALLSYVRPDR